MSKLNVWGLPRPERPRKDLELKDPHHPGVVFKVTLRAMGAVEQHRANDLAEELTNRFVRGEETFPAVGGEGILISESLCVAAAALYCMQVVPFEDEGYTPEEFIAVAATMEGVWEQLAIIATSLNAVTVGNESRAVTEPSSGLPSDTTNATPS